MTGSLLLTVNGERRTVAADPERTLLRVLRDDLGLTGAKYGCGDGKCGACTVLLDGRPVQACSTAVGDAARGAITTIEGLAQPNRLHALQVAFLAEDALQCGYCTPGMILSAAALLAEFPAPTDTEIAHALQDNLCRCGAYPRIIAAVRRAAGWLATGTTPVVGLDPSPAPDLLQAPDPFDEGLIAAYPDPDVATASFGAAAPPADARDLTQIGPIVHIAEDGAVRVYVGKAEVGQNMRAEIAQLVAEELCITPEQVAIIAGDTGRVPYDVGTFGSRTTPITGPQVLRAGATMRKLLLDLAAAAWNVDSDALVLQDGTVTEPASGRRASYGDLGRDRRIVRIADPDQPVTPPAAWTVAGHAMHKLDAQPFVTGRHQFAADLTLPGMQIGKVLRPPAFGARLVELDASAAGAIPGVAVIHEGDFAGVVAPDEATAEAAIDSMRARWQTELQVSQPELFDYLKASALERESRRGPEIPADGRVGPYFSTAGDVGQAMAAANQTLSAQYTVDYVAHVPLEPRAALAQWHGERLTVWTGTQRPFGVRDQLAAHFGLPATSVRVIVPQTGGGYGGKHAGDAAIEAARLAKATGHPVRIVWTRREEFTWAYFRPAAIIELNSAVDAHGKLSALEMTNYNSGAAGIEPVYTIPNRRITWLPADAPLRQGAYRALASTANAFARESHIDEWAHLLGEDPLAFRLRHIAEPRLAAVLEAAAYTFGWGTRTAEPHHGFGLACGADKGAVVAACVEVVVEPETRAVRVLHVVEAYECGAIINPANVRAQVEGAVIQGLGPALFEQVRFANGRILNPDFAGYRVPRFADLPRIDTILLDRRDIPSAGAGETPIIGVAPAIANAVYHATGRRVRSMPLAPDGRMRE